MELGTKIPSVFPALHWHCLLYMAIRQYNDFPRACAEGFSQKMPMLLSCRMRMASPVRLQHACVQAVVRCEMCDADVGNHKGPGVGLHCDAYGPTSAAAPASGVCHPCSKLLRRLSRAVLGTGLVSRPSRAMHTIKRLVERKVLI